ncbi:MAG: anaerobic ribonucleoside-triphosphate reductase activating protein, partial [Thermodesulfobacteriota bacterium]
DSSDGALTPEEVFDFLEKRRGMLEGVALTGGEPTLQADLPDLCRRIREMDYPVKLDTNGSRPERLKVLIAEGLIDFVAMDIKTAPDRYAPLIWPNARPEAIRQSVRAILTSGISHEFRTTAAVPPVDAAAIREIAALIEGADRYVLQRFSDARVLRPDFFSTEAGRGATEAELETFQSIVAPRVGECVIR